MKQRRFSDQQLFALRNHIPISQVIDSILCIPSKKSQGTFRFRCPLCAQFNTAIKPSTNLARCFHCEINFNPIDLVMAVKNISFVEAATLLENYKAALPPEPKHSPEKHHSVPRSIGSTDPASIGCILSNLIEKEVSYPDENKPIGATSLNDPIANRINKLEHDICLLSRQVANLTKIICNKK